MSDRSQWTVSLAPVPEHVDDAEAWAIRGAAAVGRAADLVVHANDDLAQTPVEILTDLRSTHARRFLLVATSTQPHVAARAEDVLGSARVSLPTVSNLHRADVSVTVHPQHRGSGLGSALLTAAEHIAVEHGRSTLLTWTEHSGEPPADDPGVLEPPTGSGRIDSHDAGARFALRHGYRLEQAERYSVLPLPVDPALLRHLHDDAAEHAGADHRLHTWTDAAPERWVDQFADLHTVMSTAPPVGGLELHEDPYDAPRIRASEEEVRQARHGYLAVAAEHVPSATLVAFTMVRYPLDLPEVVYQEDTLVHPDHRGRRLGMLVKTALLDRLLEVRPEAKRVHTWNAEENAAMLRINVALGFEPSGVEGLWQKHLPDGG